MIAVNGQFQNNTRNNTLINKDLAKNYIQQINEVLNHNDTEIPIADRLISDIRHISSQQNQDAQAILLHIEKMLINFLYGNNFFDRKIIKVDAKYYKLNMHLDYLSRQISIIEREVLSYIKAFPMMINSSSYYKMVIDSIDKSLDDIENDIIVDDDKPKIPMLPNLIKAVNFVKDKNKLFTQQKNLEEKVDLFTKYADQVELTEKNIKYFINEICSVQNFRVVVYFPYLYDKVVAMLEKLNQRNAINLIPSIQDYEYRCTNYKKQINLEENLKEQINLANIIYKKINNLDKKISEQADIMKTRITKLKQAIL